MKHLEQYLRKISYGDTAALEKLYQETKGALYGYALSVLRNAHDAEDVLQDAYVQVFTKAGTYRPQEKPMAWLMTIVKNLCLMKLREQKRLQPMTDGSWDAHLPGDSRLEDNDRIILQTVLEELPEDDREIIILHVLFGYKHREIAKMMQLPLSTVLSKYNRALKKVRIKMDQTSEQGGETA